MEAGEKLDRQRRPRVCAKKKRRDRLIARATREPGWRFAFADECWFSRLAQPRASAWSEPGRPLRLCERRLPAGDAGPKALACYGAYLPEQEGRQPELSEQMLVRFVEGRPVGAATCGFLDWLAGQMTNQGARVLVLFWDNASWHDCARVRRWLRAHNRRAKRGGGLRLLVCPLPKRSPWLNRIEAKWVHGKRAALEPRQVLTPEELTERLCRYYRCESVEPLSTETLPPELPETPNTGGQTRNLS